jgi:hypothetical protein
MKKTTLILLLLLAAAPLSAQRIHGFVSAGGTLSQIEGDELKSFSKWGTTAGVGAIVGFDRHETWNLSVEAAFAQRGSYNGSGDPYSISLRLDYVDIPLMVHYRDPWGGMLLGIGLCYSRLVQQPHNILRYNPNYFFPDTNDMEFLKNDLALVADLRFKVWRGLMFNIRWQYSIIAVKRDWTFTEVNTDGVKKDVWDNDCYNNSLTFRLLWQF